MVEAALQRQRSAWLARLCSALIVLAYGLAVGPASATVHDSLTTRSEDIARIEDYLNGLRTLRSNFTQINPDGGTASGKLYYARPDKMRLDYDAPSDLLIIANGWDLVYQDRRLKQVSHLFTSSTPLGFLLQDPIRLSGKVTVTDLEHRGGELRVSVVQTDEPKQGTLVLAFAEQPFELRRWTLVDAQGLATHVLLESPQTDVPIDDKLFVFHNPKFYPEERH
jgi:outer membrane lipoprotein-sorting protein